MGGLINTIYVHMENWGSHFLSWFFLSGGMGCNILGNIVIEGCHLCVPRVYSGSKLSVSRVTLFKAAARGEQSCIVWENQKLCFIANSYCFFLILIWDFFFWCDYLWGGGASAPWTPLMFSRNAPRAPPVFRSKCRGLGGGSPPGKKSVQKKFS